MSFQTTTFDNEVDYITREDPQGKTEANAAEPPAQNRTFWPNGDRIPRFPHESMLADEAVDPSGNYILRIRRPLYRLGNSSIFDLVSAPGQGDNTSTGLEEDLEFIIDAAQGNPNGTSEGDCSPLLGDPAEKASGYRPVIEDSRGRLLVGGATTFTVSRSSNSLSVLVRLGNDGVLAPPLNLTYFRYIGSTGEAVSGAAPKLTTRVYTDDLIADARASSENSALELFELGAGPEKRIYPEFFGPAYEDLTVDGETLADGDRVLLNQPPPGGAAYPGNVNNGIYVKFTEENPETQGEYRWYLIRAADFDSTQEATEGSYTFLSGGSRIGAAYRVSHFGGALDSADDDAAAAVEFVEFIPGSLTPSHGGLADLGADDHPQYLNINGRASGATPSQATVTINTNAADATVTTGGTLTISGGGASAKATLALTRIDTNNSGAALTATGTGDAALSAPGTGDARVTANAGDATVSSAGGAVAITAGGAVAITAGTTATIAAPGGVTFSTGSNAIDAGGVRLSNVAAATAADDAVTKSQLDQLAQGVFPKVAVRARSVDLLAGLGLDAGGGTATAVTDGSGPGKTLTAPGSAAPAARADLVVDGIPIPVATSPNDIDSRVLIDIQPDSVHNGVYYRSANLSGPVRWQLTRAPDFDNSPVGEVQVGTYFSVTEDQTQYFVSSFAGDLDNDPLQFGVLTSVDIGSHGSLGGLTAGDDHTQYLFLAGRAGGQTVVGGTADEEVLVLDSTASATKGRVEVAGGTTLRVNDLTAGFVVSSADGDLSTAAISGNDHVVITDSGGDVTSVGQGTAFNANFGTNANDIPDGAAVVLLAGRSGGQTIRGSSGASAQIGLATGPEADLTLTPDGTGAVVVGGTTPTVSSASTLAVVADAGAARLEATGGPAQVESTDDAVAITGQTGATVTANSGTARLEATGGPAQVESTDNAVAITGQTGATVTATTGPATVTASAGAATLTGASDATVTAAATGTATLTGGVVKVTATGAAGAVSIAASGSGGTADQPVNITPAGTGSVIVGGMTPKIEAAGNKDLVVSADNLTLSARTNGGNVNLTPDSAGAVVVGGSSTVSGAGLTVQSTGGNALALSSAGTDADITVTAARNITLTATNGVISAANGRITEVDTPLDPSDAVNKAYADLLAQGIIAREACVVRTAALESDSGATGTLFYAGSTITPPNVTGNETLTIQGVTLNTGDRVLVDEGGGSGSIHNGIYDVGTAPSGNSRWQLTRAEDFDNSPQGEVLKSYVGVTQGDSSGTFYFVTSFGGTIDTDPIVFGEYMSVPLTSHGNLDNLDADDHEQYALLEGRAGAQDLKLSTNTAATLTNDATLTVSGGGTTKGALTLTAAAANTNVNLAAGGAGTFQLTPGSNNTTWLGGDSAAQTLSARSQDLTLTGASGASLTLNAASLSLANAARTITTTAGGLTLSPGDSTTTLAGTPTLTTGEGALTVQTAAGDLVLNPAGNIDASGSRIAAVAFPAAGADAVTRDFLDVRATAADADKIAAASVRVRTSNLAVDAGVSITAGGGPGVGKWLEPNAAINSLNIDDVTDLDNAEKVLVDDGDIGGTANNGVYVFNPVGGGAGDRWRLTRDTAFDSVGAGEIEVGATVAVSEGAVNAGRSYYVVQVPATIDGPDPEDALVFARVPAHAALAGLGEDDHAQYLHLAGRADQTSLVMVPGTGTAAAATIRNHGQLTIESGNSGALALNSASDVLIIGTTGDQTIRGVDDATFTIEGGDADARASLAFAVAGADSSSVTLASAGAGAVTVDASLGLFEVIEARRIAMGKDTQVAPANSTSHQMVTDLVFVAESGGNYIAPGDEGVYFTIAASSTASEVFGVWFDTTDGATSNAPTAISGITAVNVDIHSGDSAASIAQTTADALNALTLPGGAKAFYAHARQETIRVITASQGDYALPNGATFVSTAGGTVNAVHDGLEASPAHRGSAVTGGENNQVYAAGAGGVPFAATHSVIGGGRGNMIAPPDSATADVEGITVAGGVGNRAWARSYAAIGGGWRNVTAGLAATIGGGFENTVDGSYSVASGGVFNVVETNFSVVSGGRANAVNGGTYTTIGGGYLNTVSGAGYDTISGGFRNTTSNSSFATIGGGFQNTTSATSATVVGGARNTASATSATVVGGSDSQALGNYAIAGGRSAVASGISSVALGGARFSVDETNIVSGDGGVAIGASRARVKGELAQVYGGDYSRVLSAQSTVIGGYNHIIGPLPAAQQVLTLRIGSGQTGADYADTYFFIDTPTTGFYVWFNVDGNGSDPGPFADNFRFAIPVAIAESADTATLAAAISGALNAAIDPATVTGLAFSAVLSTDVVTNDTVTATNVESGSPFYENPSLGTSAPPFMVFGAAPGADDVQGSSSIILGGNQHTIQGGSSNFLIGGGGHTMTSAIQSFILGGQDCAITSASSSTALGNVATVTHDYALVYGDGGSTNTIATASSAAKQATFRATGGFRIFTDDSESSSSGGPGALEVTAEGALQAVKFASGTTSDSASGTVHLYSKNGADLYVKDGADETQVAAGAAAFEFFDATGATEMIRPTAAGAGRSFMVGDQRDLGVDINSTAGFFYDAANNSIRGGSVTGTQWNTRGTHSVALGSGLTASGDYSVALGSGLTASGDYSVAFGHNCIARNDHSLVLGGFAGVAGKDTGTGGGEYGVVVGGRSGEATGFYSVAIGGENNHSQGEAAITMGRGLNTVTATRGIGIGFRNTVSHNLSMCIGQGGTTNAIITASSKTAQFTARFTNGYRFYTDNTDSTDTGGRASVEILPSGALQLLAGPAANANASDADSRALYVGSDDNLLHMNDEAGVTSIVKAAEVAYDNATSGLAATDVQAAIDELVGGAVRTDTASFTAGANLALTGPTPTSPQATDADFKVTARGGRRSLITWRFPLLAESENPATASGTSTQALVPFLAPVGTADPADAVSANAWNWIERAADVGFAVVEPAADTEYTWFVATAEAETAPTPYYAAGTTATLDLVELAEFEAYAATAAIASRDRTLLWADSQENVGTGREQTTPAALDEALKSSVPGGEWLRLFTTPMVQGSGVNLAAHAYLQDVGADDAAVAARFDYFTDNIRTGVRFTPAQLALTTADGASELYQWIRAYTTGSGNPGGANIVSPPAGAAATPAPSVLSLALDRFDTVSATFTAPTNVSYPANTNAVTLDPGSWELQLPAGRHLLVWSVPFLVAYDGDAADTTTTFIGPDGNSANAVAPPVAWGISATNTQFRAVDTGARLVDVPAGGATYTWWAQPSVASGGALFASEGLYSGAPGVDNGGRATLLAIPMTAARPAVERTPAQRTFRVTGGADATTPYAPRVALTAAYDTVVCDLQADRTLLLPPLADTTDGYEYRFEAEVGGDGASPASGRTVVRAADATADRISTVSSGATGWSEFALSSPGGALTLRARPGRGVWEVAAGAAAWYRRDPAAAAPVAVVALPALRDAAGDFALDATPVTGDRYLLGQCRALQAGDAIDVAGTLGLTIGEASPGRYFRGIIRVDFPSDSHTVFGTRDIGTVAASQENNSPYLSTTAGFSARFVAPDAGLYRFVVHMQDVNGAVTLDDVQTTFTLRPRGSLPAARQFSSRATAVSAVTSGGFTATDPWAVFPAGTIGVDAPADNRREIPELAFDVGDPAGEVVGLRATLVAHKYFASTPFCRYSLVVAAPSGAETTLPGAVTHGAPNTLFSSHALGATFEPAEAGRHRVFLRAWDAQYQSANLLRVVDLGGDVSVERRAASARDLAPGRALYAGACGATADVEVVADAGLNNYECFFVSSADREFVVWYNRFEGPLGDSIRPPQDVIGASLADYESAVFISVRIAEGTLSDELVVERTRAAVMANTEFARRFAAIGVSSTGTGTVDRLRIVALEAGPTLSAWGDSGSNATLTPAPYRLLIANQTSPYVPAGFYGRYWTFATAAERYYVWYDNAANDHADPAVAGRTGIRVEIAGSAIATDNAATASAVATAIGGTTVALSPEVQDVVVFPGSGRPLEEPTMGNIAHANFFVSEQRFDSGTPAPPDGYLAPVGGFHFARPADPDGVYCVEVDAGVTLRTSDAANTSSGAEWPFRLLLEAPDGTRTELCPPRAHGQKNDPSLEPDHVNDIPLGGGAVLGAEGTYVILAEKGASVNGDADGFNFETTRCRARLWRAAGGLRRGHAAPTAPVDAPADYLPGFRALHGNDDYPGGPAAWGDGAFGVLAPAGRTLISWTADVSSVEGRHYPHLAPLGSPGPESAVFRSNHFNVATGGSLNTDNGFVVVENAYPTRYTWYSDVNLSAAGVYRLAGGLGARFHIRAVSLDGHFESQQRVYKNPAGADTVVNSGEGDATTTDGDKQNSMLTVDERLKTSTAPGTWLTAHSLAYYNPLGSNVPTYLYLQDPGAGLGQGAAFDDSASAVTFSDENTDSSRLIQLFDLYTETTVREQALWARCDDTAGQAMFSELATVNEVRRATATATAICLDGVATRVATYVGGAVYYPRDADVTVTLDGLELALDEGPWVIAWMVPYEAPAGIGGVRSFIAPKDVITFAAAEYDRPEVLVTRRWEDPAELSRTLDAGATYVDVPAGGRRYAWYAAAGAQGAAGAAGAERILHRSDFGTGRGPNRRALGADFNNTARLFAFKLEAGSGPAAAPPGVSLLGVDYGEATTNPASATAGFSKRVALTAAPEVVDVDTTANARGLELPPIADVGARAFTIKRRGVNEVVVSAAGGDTVEGAATLTLTANGQHVRLVSNPRTGNWIVVA